MSRFGNPVSFANWIKIDPNAKGLRMTPATEVTKESLEHVKKYWNCPSAEIGDYLLAAANGRGSIMKADEFLATYTPAQTTA